MNRSQEPNQEQALLKISPSCQHETKEEGKNSGARQGPNFYSPESYREGTSTKESLKRNIPFSIEWKQNAKVEKKRNSSVLVVRFLYMDGINIAFKKRTERFLFLCIYLYFLLCISGGLACGEEKGDGKCSDQTSRKGPRAPRRGCTPVLVGQWGLPLWLSLSLSAPLQSS